MMQPAAGQEQVAAALLQEFAPGLAVPAVVPAGLPDGVPAGVPAGTPAAAALSPELTARPAQATVALPAGPMPSGLDSTASAVESHTRPPAEGPAMTPAGGPAMLQPAAGQEQVAAALPASSPPAGMLRASAAEGVSTAARAEELHICFDTLIHITNARADVPSWCDHS